MKRFLGIIGSPRRNANTQILVAKILQGAAYEGVLTEATFLADLDINECDGCHVCWKGKPCAKKDDMNELYPKIMAADILVFGTPVYWYGPTAIMKAFIDRFVYFNCPENRKKIRGKTAVIAIPFEEQNTETGEFVAAFFEKCFAYLEIKPGGKILAPGVGARGEVLKKQKLLDQAHELGRRLAREKI
ncbi:MAG: flavodoxin family protein [Spirochaetales bacterium]|nr:flavodoxin family protein [Spirochaetales bacterium]